MYHGVTGAKDFSINGRHLPVAELEKHLSYLKKHFDILPLESLCTARKEYKKKRALAITFDDGYLNNVQHAIPVLKRLKVPATFFVSTACLSDNNYIHPSDYIDLINSSDRSDTININGKPFKRKGKQLFHSGVNAYTFINTLKFFECKKTFEFLKKEYPAREITASVNPEIYRVVSADNISQLSAPMCSVGSHSHDHVNLTQLSSEELKTQISLSKDTLQRFTGMKIDAIAFPYGYFNQGIIDVSLQAGFHLLIAGGSVPDQFNGKVFPRIGVLNMAGYAYNMLSINLGFRKFGF
jgi:peptidoglycan/xylan/chitin deacetylase (PgdA/CDA1 family)